MNPKPATPPFTLPPIFSAVRNGMKIYVVPRAGLPLVSLHLIFPYGAETDPPGKAGLTDLAAEMLTLGTRRRSAAQIASEVDGLGASLSAHAGWDATALHLQGLKEDLDRLLELLREMVAEPSFPEEEFAQLQQRRVATLVQQKDESQIVAGERFEEILFRGTPYDHPVYGTLKTVPLISRDEVQDFYRRRSLPEGSFWVLVGDVDPEDCFRRLEANFSILTPGPIQASPFNPAPPHGIRTFLIDRPDLTQSQIRLGHLGIPPAHPDLCPFEVMNYILGGGGFSSRLMQRIRVELGLTYGIRSSLDLRRQAGPFAVATFTPTATTFELRGGKLVDFEIISGSGRIKNRKGRSRSIFAGKLSPEIRDPGPGGAKDSANGDIWTGNRFPVGLPRKNRRDRGNGYSSLRAGRISIPKT